MTAPPLRQLALASPHLLMQVELDFRLFLHHPREAIPEPFEIQGPGEGQETKSRRSAVVMGRVLRKKKKQRTNSTGCRTNRSSLRLLLDLFSVETTELGLSGLYDEDADDDAPSGDISPSTLERTAALLEL